MFIRRNMSSNVSYQQLKEYPMFKQLFKLNDVMILKQILPMAVKKVSFNTFKQNINRYNMIFIPEENVQGIISTQPIESITNQNALELKITQNLQNSKIKFFMIETKIYKILKFIFYKKLQCMQNLNSFQKLNFLYRSSLDQVPFGGYIYRKDDQITSIYYLVRGQVQITKSFDEKEINICSLHEGTFFGLYQFDQNKTKRLLNAQSCSNDTIVLSFSLNMLNELFGKDEDEILTKLLSLQSQTFKVKHEENKKAFIVDTKVKKSNFIKAYEFQRRLTKFSQEREIDRKNPVFGRYIQNKSLLFKIKDSNDSVPRFEQQNFKLVSNFHKNSTMLKYHNRLNQHRMTTLGSNMDKTKQNKQNNKNKLSVLKPSQVLSSRIQHRFNTLKRNFSATGFDQLSISRKSQEC